MLHGRIRVLLSICRTRLRQKFTQPNESSPLKIMMNQGLIFKYFELPNLRLEFLARVFLIASFFSLPISTAATNVFMGLTLITWTLAGGYKTRVNQLSGNWFSYGVVLLFAVICVGGTYSTGSTNEIFFKFTNTQKFYSYSLQSHYYKITNGAGIH